MIWSAVLKNFYCNLENAGITQSCGFYYCCWLKYTGYLFLSLATHLFFIQITHKYQYLIKWDAFPSPKKFLHIVFARLWCMWVPVGQFGLPSFDQLTLVVLVISEKTENELKKNTPTTAHWPVGFLVRTTSHSQLSFSTSNCSGILNFLSGHIVHVKLSLLKQNTACAK